MITTDQKARKILTYLRPDMNEQYAPTLREGYVKDIISLIETGKLPDEDEKDV